MTSRAVKLAAAGLCGLALSATRCVQNPVVSLELPVNSITTMRQDLPAVANVGPDGNFVVVWRDSSGADGSNRGVRARMFTVTAASVGTEFGVNAATTNGQGRPSVASNEDGDFVVTWTDYGPGDSNSEVWARRFDASGVPQGGDIHVNTYTTSAQSDSRVALDSTGNFVVVWDSNEQDGSIIGVFGQRFDNTGAKVGGEFQINQYTTGVQAVPSIAMRPSGEFLVVWHSPQDAQSSAIMARRYAANATPLGAEFQVNTTEPLPQQQARVDYAPDGSAVVVWASFGQDGDGNGIFGQRLDATGAKLGPEFNVNTYTTGNQGYPDVRVAPSGDFAVVWDSPQDGGSYGVYAQQFDATGRRVGVELPVNAYTTGDQGRARVTSQPNGQYVAVWQSDGADGSDYGIFMRLAGFPETRPIVVDTLHPSVAQGGSNHNGVLEMGEPAIIEPAFRNNSAAPLALEGTILQLRSNPGPTLTAIDDDADYGTIAPGATNDCFTATGDCFQLEVTGSRPDPHFDILMDELISYQGFTRSAALHVGGSFPDVPQNAFYPFIETLLHNGITGGCGGGNYCPLGNVTRAQMSVFLLKSRWGSGFLPPPATGTAFPDVPANHPFGRWIEELVREGITAGCGGGLYCPDNPVTRQQMAVFLLKTKYGANHVPPNGVGLFGDVSPCPGTVCNFIEELYGLGVTGGCQATPLLYCPQNLNLRQQMAAFLTKTFGLELYGN